MNYSFEEINQKVNVAIGVLFKNDAFLLENDVNERSVSHKLAEYLQKQFPDWNVDCEYNRMKNQNNDEEYITKKLKLSIEDIKSDDAHAKTVYPDIIIHKRGTEHNLLVIEIKRYSNNSSKEFDFQKLKAFTSELEYALGLYIEFNRINEPVLKWFKDGEEI